MPITLQDVINAKISTNWIHSIYYPRLVTAYNSAEAWIKAGAPAMLPFTQPEAGAIKSAVGGCLRAAPTISGYKDSSDVWNNYMQTRTDMSLGVAIDFYRLWHGWIFNNQQATIGAAAPAPAPAPAPKYVPNPPNLIDKALQQHAQAVLGHGPLNKGNGNPFDYKKLPKRIEIRNGSTIFNESKW